MTVCGSLTSALEAKKDQLWCFYMVRAGARSGVITWHGKVCTATYHSLFRCSPWAGWSGSRHYYDRNAHVRLKLPLLSPICLLEALSPEGHRLKGPAHATLMTVHSKRQEIGKTCRVYAVDLRFHGGSGRPEWVGDFSGTLLFWLHHAILFYSFFTPKRLQGYHVARLAADLHDLLQILDLWVRMCSLHYQCTRSNKHWRAGTEPGATGAVQEVTVVGSSMGASVIWSYIELYGHTHLGKLVFVDQTPLQVLIVPATPAYASACHRCKHQLQIYQMSTSSLPAVSNPAFFHCWFLPEQKGS